MPVFFQLIPAPTLVRYLGDGLLFVEGEIQPLSGPETEVECAKEWRELMAKNAREEAELLADRLEM